VFRKTLTLATAAAAIAALAVGGATAAVGRNAGPLQARAGCNDKKVVVTYYSEPSVQDFQQFGTDGDNDVRANLVETLLDRKTVAGKYATTTFGLTGSYKGRLANAWRLDSKKKTLTFTLRPGVQFSDGTPMTAADVKFSFVRGMLDPASYLGSLMKMLTISKTSQITTPNARTVVFKLQKFNPFTYDLMSIWASAVTSQKAVKAHATSKDPWANDWMKNHLVGTGPYVLSKAQPGVEYDFTPNTHYWNARQWPCNGGIVVKVIPNASNRLELLKRGSVDVARSLDYKDIAALSKSKGIQVLRYQSTDMREIALNVKQKPFDDVRVRRAIAYAIPYQQILQTVWHGYATQLKSIVPVGQPTAAPTTWPYTTDLTKAKQLLAQASLASGFSTTLYTRAEDPEDQQAAVLIQASLAKIGVKVQIEKLLTAAYAAKQFGDRDMPMFFWNWISFTNDPFYGFNFLVQTGQGTNYANYSNATVDKLIQQGMYEPNRTKRASISRTIQKMVANDAFAIGLAQPDSIVAMRSSVHGWMQYPDLNARYYTLWKD